MSENYSSDNLSWVLGMMEDRNTESERIRAAIAAAIRARGEVQQ